MAYPRLAKLLKVADPYSKEACIIEWLLLVMTLKEYLPWIVLADFMGMALIDRLAVVVIIDCYLRQIITTTIEVAAKIKYSGFGFDLEFDATVAMMNVEPIAELEFTAECVSAE